MTEKETTNAVKQKKLLFKIHKTKGNARAGTVTLNWVTFNTPCFMPVWTKSTLKWIPYERLDASHTWCDQDFNIILNNTFHLYLRPWDKRMKKLGGMHTFQNRDRLILTDSWWFQVFSLWLWKEWGWLVKLFPDRVEFQSPYDWSKHVFTPTWVVDIQRNLWSDIMMMLDVCAPVHNISKWKVAHYMEMTHRRARTQFEYHTKHYDQHRWVLFPIVQWWLYTDLREKSLRVLSEFAVDWIAVWWLSVGETKEELQEIMEFCSDKMPTDVPRYLMWVWTPEDLRNAIAQGFDMFDCVLPTRVWRHGTAFTATGQIKLRAWKYAEDTSPLEETCPCFVCRNHTKAYIHHLVKEKEMMWASLLSFHNIAYLQFCVQEIRNDILSE